MEHRLAEFALNPVSINDVGQIAICVRLSDGRPFVLRADPVEPGLKQAVVH